MLFWIYFLNVSGVHITYTWGLLVCINGQITHFNFVLQLVQLLLDHGAHLDQPNKAGDCPWLLISVNPFNNIPLINYSSLRCMAATVVCKHSIPYKGQIPKTLEMFVSFHEEYPYWLYFYTIFYKIICIHFTLLLLHYVNILMKLI